MGYGIVWVMVYSKSYYYTSYVSNLFKALSIMFDFVSTTFPIQGNYSLKNNLLYNN